ncbi:DUF11 domain-containing protein [Arcticibacterium luteifluviistationis]|uniref:DUF11 domain-containing protein n=1 Tax=Arcticibacterium luteifluviistationis TaxID=1784714 RepID=A0A2Z4GCN9_9BACT|nr:DUF11 domain-containing protein [Arcticibacterium luteifluviistationis]AWV98860.1 hypothetical protein DJ013_12035 [Arcticibacterium luteifluviistationis]
MELLIKNREKLAMKGLGRFGFILLSACLSLIANTKAFSQECAEKIEFTVQSIDESAEGVGDAKLVLSGVPANTYIVDYSSGSTYSGSGTATYGTLTAATEALTLGRYIATGLANPATPAGQQYTVRVEMPDNSCYSDSTIVLPRVNWSAEPDYTDLDVTVAKSGDAATVGATVVVTVSVTNDDTNAGVNTVDATGVEIVINPPASGLVYNTGTAATGGNGTYDESTLIWSVGTVPAGATYTLQLTYTVNERGVFQIGSEVKTTTGTIDELDSMPLDEGGAANFEDEDDESSTCISTPWDWCTTDSFDFTLISDVYDDIIWQKGGVDITASVAGEYTINADGSLTILSVGSYNFRYVSPTGNASCDAVGCCPIDIIQGIRPDLLDMPPAAICLNETLPTVIAQDDTDPGAYDSDRGQVVYQWFNDNGTDNPNTDSLTGQTSLTLDLSSLPQTAGTYYYKVKALDELHATCIDSTIFEFVITDIEKPIANANTPICEEEQIELTVTNMTDYPGTAYDFDWWYEANATVFTAVGDSVGILDADPTTHSGDYVVQVSQTFTNPFSSGSVDTYCAKTDTVTMLVNPLPEPPVMKDSTYCQYDVIAEYIEHVVDSTGGYLSWYQTAVRDTPFYTTNLWDKPDSSVSGQVGPYYVTQTDLNGCESYPDSFVVNINALPEPPVVQDLAYCEGETNTLPLTATPLSAAYTLTWYDDTLATGAGGTIADPAIPTPDASAVDTLRFYVTQTFGTTACESYNAELVVYIKDTPDRPGFADPVYCLEETAVSLDNHLTPSAVSTTTPSATFTHWTYPGFIDDGSAVPTPTTNDAGSSYGLVWETWEYIAPDASTLSCEGPMEDLRVIVNPKPNVELVAVNALCVGDAAQDDARLYITDYRDSDVLLWHLGDTFVAASAGASQTGTDIRALGGAFASNLTNPEVGDGARNYAIQITNEFGCVETGVVPLTEKDCVCPGGYCEPASITRTL